MIGRLYSNLTISDHHIMLRFKPDLVQCNYVASDDDLKVTVIRIVCQLIDGHFYNMDISRAVEFFQKIGNDKAVELLTSYKTRLDEEVCLFGGSTLLSVIPVDSERASTTDCKENSYPNSVLEGATINMREHLEQHPYRQVTGGASAVLESTFDWRELKMTDGNKTAAGHEERITELKERFEKVEIEEGKNLCSRGNDEGAEESGKEQSAGVVEIPVVFDKKGNVIEGVNGKEEKRVEGLKNDDICKTGGNGHKRQDSVSSEESFVDVRLELDKLCVDGNDSGKHHETGLTEETLDKGENELRERAPSQSSIEEDFEIVSEEMASLSVNEYGVLISNECSGQEIGETLWKGEASLEGIESSLKSEENKLPLEKGLQAGGTEEGLECCVKQSIDGEIGEKASSDEGKEKENLNEIVSHADEGMRKPLRSDEASVGIEGQEKLGEKDVVEGVRTLNLSAETNGSATAGNCHKLKNTPITFSIPKAEMDYKKCELKLSIAGILKSSQYSTNALNLGQRIWDHLLPSGDHLLLPSIFEGLGFTLEKIDDGPEVTFTIGIRDSRSWYDLVWSVMDGYLERLLTGFMLSGQQEDMTGSNLPLITVRIDKDSFKENEEYFRFRPTDFIPVTAYPRFFIVMLEYIMAWAHSCIEELFGCGTNIPDQLLYKCTATKEEYEEWFIHNHDDQLPEVDDIMPVPVTFEWAMDGCCVGCDGRRCELVKSSNCLPRPGQTKYMPTFLFEDFYAYHDKLPINRIEHLLRTKPDGTYMIWNNIQCKGQCFVLSVHFNGVSHHYPITRGTDYRFSVISHKWFPTLDVLLHYYQQEADGLVTTLKYELYNPYWYQRRRRKKAQEKVQGYRKLKNPSLIVKVEYQKEDGPLSDAVREIWRHRLTIPPKDNVITLFFDNHDVKLQEINECNPFQLEIHVTVSSLDNLQAFQEKISSAVFSKLLPQILLEGANETTTVNVTPNIASFTVARMTWLTSNPKPIAMTPQRKRHSNTENKEKATTKESCTFKRPKMVGTIRGVQRIFSHPVFLNEIDAHDCRDMCALAESLIQEQGTIEAYIPASSWIFNHREDIPFQSVDRVLRTKPNGTYFLWRQMSCIARMNFDIMSVHYNGLTYHYQVTENAHDMSQRYDQYVVFQNEKNPPVVVVVSANPKDNVTLSEAGCQCIPCMSFSLEDNILSLFFENLDVKLIGIVMSSKFEFAIQVKVSSQRVLEEFEEKICSGYLDEYLPQILFDGACRNARVKVTRDTMSFTWAKHLFAKRQNNKLSQDSSTKAAGTWSNQDVTEEAGSVYKAAGFKNTESTEDKDMETSNSAESSRVLPSYPPESWFFEGINTKQASDILSQLPVGTFLVSDSESEEGKVSYLLSVRGKHAVENGTVIQDTTGVFCIGSKTFESLSMLVDYFRCHSVKEVVTSEDVCLTLSFKEALNLRMQKYKYEAYAIARYPYTASTKCKEISLQVGDIVPLTVKHDEDSFSSEISCHMGIMNGQEGFFPADCVEIIAER